MTIQRIIIPSSFTNHTSLLNLGMTIQAIVIPKFKTPLWHSPSLSYSPFLTYTYIRIYTRTPLLYFDCFWSFFIKNLLVTCSQAIIACWLLINLVFKPLFCRIFEFHKALFRDFLLHYMRFELVFGLQSLLWSYPGFSITFESVA